MEFFTVFMFDEFLFAVKMQTVAMLQLEKGRQKLNKVKNIYILKLC